MPTRRRLRTELVQEPAPHAHVRRLRDRDADPGDHGDRRSTLNPPEPARRGQLSSSSASQTGLLLPAFALRITSAFLLVIVVALFGGDAIAGEATWGNLRYLLMRPIGAWAPRARQVRWSRCSARGSRSCSSWSPALVVGVDRLRHRPDRVPADASSGRPVDRRRSSTTSRVSTAYVAWSLTGVVSFSFMVSCMTDAPFGAIFAGVGLYFTSLILDSISSLGSIRYGLPTHYFDAWVDSS